MQPTRPSIRDFCFVGIFTAIIAVCAQISIPMPVGVPMTMQTFAIPLAGIVLGKKNGTLSTALYILLGLMGAPVFAGFTGGLGVIFGRTGGFILSFPLMAFTAAIGAEKDHDLWLLYWLIVGVVINFLCGLLMYSFVTSAGLMLSFSSAVAPFIPTAIVKIVMVAAIGTRVKMALIKADLINY